MENSIQGRNITGELDSVLMKNHHNHQLVVKDATTSEGIQQGR